MTKTEYVPYVTKVPAKAEWKLDPAKCFGSSRVLINDGVAVDARPTEWREDAKGNAAAAICYSTTCNLCGHRIEIRDTEIRSPAQCTWCRPYNRRTVKITGTTS